jgi:hypothetical protein
MSYLYSLYGQGFLLIKNSQSYKTQANPKVPNNNPVERWFGYLKNNILKKRTNLMPSEFVGPFKAD